MSWLNPRVHECLWHVVPGHYYVIVKEDQEGHPTMHDENCVEVREDD